MSGRHTGDPDPKVLGARLYEIILTTSATARGEEATRETLGKPKLGITGAALQARVRTNTFEVARVIVQAVAQDWPAARVVDAVIQATHAGFPPKVRKLRKHQTFRRAETGQQYGTAPRLLRAWVRRFKRTLARIVNKPEPAQRAAWVEWMWDHVGHPLADGCGRTAKAMSAWVLVRHGLPLPRHPSKEAYNLAMAAGYRAFLAYYERCVREAVGRRGSKKRSPPRQNPSAHHNPDPVAKLKMAS